MANIDPAPSWANIRRLETSDRNMAGPGGILNDPTTSIAARLNLLRDNDTSLGNSVASVNTRQDATDNAIANIEGQVLNAPGTLSDLENGPALDPVAGFPDVPSVENALGPVDAINESIDSLTARTKDLDNRVRAVGLPTGALQVGYKPPDARAVASSLGLKIDESPMQPIASYGAVPVMPGAAVPFDSAPALQKLIDDAFDRQSRMQAHNGGPTRGNIVIDLGGREYYISTPLTYPANGGYVTFQNGFISAADDFPLGSFLVNKRTGSGTNDGILFDRIVFNGRNRAQGLRFTAAIRCLVTRCLFTANNGIGLHADAFTIELMCSSTFFFQSFNDTAVAGTTGIRVENQSTDNHFTDIVERANEVGVDSYSQANTYKSVHVYGHDHRVDPNRWGIRLRSNTSNNRLNDCQFDDGCRLLIENPSRTQVRGCSFATLSGDPVNCIVLTAVTNNHFCSALLITGNVFNVPSGSDAIIKAADSLTFSVNEFRRTLIADNATSPGVNLRATRFRKLVSVSASKGATVDMSADCLIGNFRFLRVSARNGTPSSPVTGITASGGTGYTNGTFPIVITGEGTGAVGFVEVVGGVVQPPVLLSRGYGYRSVPTVTATGLTGGSGNIFTATIGTAVVAKAEPWVSANNSANYTLTWASDAAIDGQLQIEVDTAVWDV